MKQKRLHYIKTSDFTLDIDLENGYCVRATVKYNYEKRNYEVLFYIKENTIDNYVSIETLNNEKISFYGDKRNVKVSILHFVSSCLSDNYFDDCIEHYEYEIKCFDRGHELFESEKIQNKGSITK